MSEPIQRPDYIRIGGNVVMQAPLALKQSQMYGFFVRGQRAKLQSTVDQTLNAPAAGRMRFKVLSPYVMLTFTRVGHANSTVPQFRDEGWGTETDIVTWVLGGGGLLSGAPERAGESGRGDGREKLTRRQPQ